MILETTLGPMDSMLLSKKTETRNGEVTTSYYYKGQLVKQNVEIVPQGVSSTGTIGQIG